MHIRRAKAYPGMGFDGHNKRGRARWATQCTVTAAEADDCSNFEYTRSACPGPEFPQPSQRGDTGSSRSPAGRGSRRHGSTTGEHGPISRQTCSTRSPQEARLSPTFNVRTSRKPSKTSNATSNEDHTPADHYSRGTCAPENTRRSPRNRTIVAITFAAIKTDTSSVREGSAVRECSTNSAPLVTTNPRAKTTSPCRYCLMIPAVPRIPNVNRRFTAVFAIAEIKSANTFASCDAQ